MYLKVILTSGAELLFPLAFWKATEIERAVKDYHVVDSVLVGAGA